MHSCLSEVIHVCFSTYFLYTVLYKDVKESGPVGWRVGGRRGGWVGKEAAAAHTREASVRFCCSENRRRRLHCPQAGKRTSWRQQRRSSERPYFVPSRRCRCCFFISFICCSRPFFFFFLKTQLYLLFSYSSSRTIFHTSSTICFNSQSIKIFFFPLLHVITCSWFIFTDLCSESKNK